MSGPSGPIPEPARLPDVPDGTGGCGACDGVQPSTPQAVHNRQGLQTIRARAGTWAQFRASLHAGLSDTDLAAVATYTKNAWSNQTGKLIQPAEFLAARAK